MVRRRTGRKEVPLSQRKAPVSVSLTGDDLRIARERGMDLGQMLHRDIQLASGQDPEEVEIERLAGEIEKIRLDLAPREQRLEFLRRRQLDRRKLKVDLQIEEDCGAWYLRSLMENGRIRRIEPVPMLPADIMGLCMSLKKANGYDFIEVGGEAYFYGKNTAEVNRRLAPVKLRIQHGKVVPDPDSMKPYVLPSSIPNLSVDRKFFEDFSERKITTSVLLSELKGYSPRITDEKLKEEIKKKMRPNYAGTMDLDLEGAQ